MKTLYISDLDGTLLDPDGTISDFTVQTINKLIMNGMIFSYATARSVSSATAVTKGLELKSPVIVHIGVFVVDLKTGVKIQKNIFPPDTVRLICGYMSKMKIYPLVYSFVDNAERVSWLSGKENDGILDYISTRRGDKRLRQVFGWDTLFAGDIFYFTCIGERAELLPLYSHFNNTDLCNIVLAQEIYRPEYWCELMPKNANKAVAALKLKEVLGCDKIVSFGDGLNDIPMFQISDECYAMSNAEPELKRIATAVIGSNQNNGVAEWLSRNSFKV